MQKSILYVHSQLKKPLISHQALPSLVKAWSQLLN